LTEVEHAVSDSRAANTKSDQSTRKLRQGRCSLVALSWRSQDRSCLTCSVISATLSRVRPCRRAVGSSRSNSHGPVRSRLSMEVQPGAPNLPGRPAGRERLHLRAIPQASSNLRAVGQPQQRDLANASVNVAAKKRRLVAVRMHDACWQDFPARSRRELAGRLGSIQPGLSDIKARSSVVTI
jgi:hypothetical protein